MTDETKEGAVLTEITIRYAKSAFCRTIHADGAWGGITPQGNIQMGMYSERHAHPEAIVFDVVGEPGATVGRLKEKEVLGRGHVREIEADIILSPSVAKAIQEWLTGQLKNLEEQRAKAGSSEGG